MYAFSQFFIEIRTIISNYVTNGSCDMFVRPVKLTVVILDIEILNAQYQTTNITKPLIGMTITPVVVLWDPPLISLLPLPERTVLFVTPFGLQLSNIFHRKKNCDISGKGICYQHGDREASCLHWWVSQYTNSPLFTGPTILLVLLARRISYYISSCAPFFVCFVCNYFVSYLPPTDRPTGWLNLVLYQFLCTFFRLFCP